MGSVKNEHFAIYTWGVFFTLGHLFLDIANSMSSLLHRPIRHFAYKLLFYRA